MTLAEIVEQWLEANGYDGLAGCSCGCRGEGLMDCEYPNPNECVAGHWNTKASEMRPGKAKG